MADKLAPFAIPVVFSVNQRQFEIYSALIPAGQFVPDAPGNTLPVTGPLKGLLSVHQQFPSNDLLLLACDMLDLDGPTIGKMIAAYRASACGHTKSMDHGERNDRGVHDFFVYQGAKFAQPFCGIYTSGGLAPAYARALQAGSRDFSLQSLLNGGKTKRIPIDRMEAFENYNAL
jgi:molybdenum cofactor guanylyltransferase